MHTPDFDCQFFTLTEVQKITSVSASTIYRLIAAGQFPAPIKIGNSNRWARAAVSAWVQSRLECLA